MVINRNNFEEEYIFAIGWGTIYFGGPTSSTLQEVNVRVWEQNQCVTNYKTLDRDVLDTMMCAGETNRDSCQVTQKTRTKYGKNINFCPG